MSHWRKNLEAALGALKKAYQHPEIWSPAAAAANQLDTGSDNIPPPTATYAPDKVRIEHNMPDFTKRRFESFEAERLAKLGYSPEESMRMAVSGNSDSIRSTPLRRGLGGSAPSLSRQGQSVDDMEDARKRGYKGN